MAECTLISFGWKYGRPASNYYFDVGFAANPARLAGKSFFSPLDDSMRRYVLDQTNVTMFIRLVVPLIKLLASIDQRQIFAFGCNSGRHRSRVIVEDIAARLGLEGIDVDVEHRDDGSRS